MILKSLRLTSILLLAGAALSLSSCINDAAPEECAVQEPTSPSVVLRLSVDTGLDIATRTDKGKPDDYDGPVGDFEKVSKLRVLIIHQMNDAGTQGRVEANRLVKTNDQGAPIFDNLEFKVNAEEKKRIYLIANEDFLSAPENTSYKSATEFLNSFVEDKYITGDGNKMMDLSVLANWTVSMPGTGTNPITATEGIFNPSKNISRLPLTESFDLFLTREKNPNAGEVQTVMAVDDICHANLFMVRAAAKARFFITGTNDFTPGTRITAITLSGISNKEFVFPNNAVYDPSKESLIKLNPNDSKPDGNKKAFITFFEAPKADTVVYTINKLGLDNQGFDIKKYNHTLIIPNSEIKITGTPITEIIYFPESIVKEAGKKFWVGVEINNDYWIYAPLETNILSMKGVDAIARGTFLPITIEFKGTMQIIARVLPWTPEYYYFDFSDHVGMASDGALSFLTGTYAEDGLDKTTARLVLPQYPDAASGSFTIGSPVGHRWDAYIITTKGEQNAIQFVTKDVNNNFVSTDHLTGTAGEKVDFKVAATMSAGSEQREAIMQVMVTLDYGGITVPVNVLEGGDYGEGTENITFIQNAR